MTQDSDKKTYKTA